MARDYPTIRRRAALGALAGSLAVAVSIVGGPSASRADVADDTLQRIASCLHERHALSIVLLVDTSGSLKTTDPGNDRIAAARLALSNFASLAAIDDGGRKPKIEVMLAGFSSRFEPIVSWTALNAKWRTSFDGPLESFASRNEGIDTDFPTALIGSQRELAARAPRACKAVLLFTDGKYDVVDSSSQARVDAGLTKEYAPGISLDEDGSSDQVEALGRDLLCRADGLADSLRRDRITLVTLALAARIEPVDQQFLRALSEGRADGATCGARTAGTGAYLAAAQLSELKQQFNRVTSAIAGGRAIASSGDSVPVCSRDACDAGRHAVPVDAAADRVSLLVDTGGEGVDATIDLPDGAGSISVTAGESGSDSVGGTEVQWTWVDDHTLNVEANLSGEQVAGDKTSADGAAGDWHVTLVQRDGEATGPARIDAYLYNGWEPALYLDSFLLEGVEQSVLVEIVGNDGDAVNVNNYRGTVALRAAIRIAGNGDADPTPVEVVGPDRQGRYSFTYEAPAGSYEAPDGTAGTAELQLDLEVTTAQGVELAPVTERLSIEVRQPDVYPTILTTRADLGDTRGTSTAVGSIEVVGGRDRTGCAWVTALRVDTAPEGSEPIEWSASNTTPEACEKVLAGATESIDLELRPAHAADGVVRGEIEIAYHAGTDTETRAATVPFEWQLLPPIDQGQRLGLFVVIMVIGLAAPVGALYLVNRRFARFASPAGLRVVQVPIAARQTFGRLMTLGLYEDADAAGDLRTVARVAPDGTLVPLVLTRFDCHDVDASAVGARLIRYNGLTFRARSDRNPFTAPHAVVQSDQPVASGPLEGRDSTVSDAIPLALAGRWFVVLPEDPPAAPDGWVGAEAVAFLAGGDLDAELADVSASLDDQAGRLVNALHDRREGNST